MSTTTAFIGGGNMAAALIGGLLRSGGSAAELHVVEPLEAQRDKLKREYGVHVQAAADAALAQAAVVVWAVKPQNFRAAAAPCRPFVGTALHLSVMAGIRSDTLAEATGSARIVRAMPNTPALIGQGISGLYARPAVTPQERERAQALLAPAGATLWVERESDLDAVTALSGSGPAYVFYFLEALITAAQRLGLSPTQGRELALATFGGATELARRSTEPLALLRERVTSKGGTTYAALEQLREAHVQEHIEAAVCAAAQRARELGDEFGQRPVTPP